MVQDSVSAAPRPRAARNSAAPSLVAREHLWPAVEWAGSVRRGVWPSLATLGTCTARRDGDAARRDAGPAGAAPTTAQAPLRIAMIAKSASNPSFVAARLGAETRARELGARLRASHRDRVADAAAGETARCRRNASRRR